MSYALRSLIDLAAALPRVEDPWPNTIGLSFPFSTAGAGGVLANVFWARGSAAEQNRVTTLGGVVGFRLGAFAYLALSANQLLSSV